MINLHDTYVAGTVFELVTFGLQIRTGTDKFNSYTLADHVTSETLLGFVSFVTYNKG